MFECDYNGMTIIPTLMYSLLRSADPTKELAVHIACDKRFMTEGGADMARGIAVKFPFSKVEFHDFTPFDEQYGKFLDTVPPTWPPITWAFAFCAELMPEVTGNLVFLDWDTFVFKDLEELYSLDLEGEGYVAAAVSEATRAERPDLVAAEWPESAGPSINVGSIVMNVDAFRRERIVHKMMDWFRKYKGRTACLEQDAINVVCGERIKRVHPRWNLFAGWGERPIRMNPFAKLWRSQPPRAMLEAVVDPGVVHFIGGRKPWKYNHCPYRNAYRQVMIELGLIKHDLPGETGTKKWIKGPAYDFYHWLIRNYSRMLLKILS